jgi:hypothetical protein
LTWKAHLMTADYHRGCAGAVGIHPLVDGSRVSSIRGALTDFNQKFVGS